jgi:large subunit ribosomal protein L10
MKTRERKQEDLNAFTEHLNNSKSAMIVSFTKLTVGKDQEFRNQLRDVGAEYQVVKNTLARIAVKGTPYEGASEHLKGVTGIAWTENDAVVLSKAVSKFVKDNADIYTFKAGIVEGRVVNLKQVEAIASLPSKEELIAKLMFVLNAQAQRIVTVINAVPRNLAVVIKQIGEGKTDAPAEPKIEAKAEQPAVEDAKTEEPKQEETEQTFEQKSETEVKSDAGAQETEQSAEQETSQEAAPEAGSEEEKSE